MKTQIHRSGQMGALPKHEATNKEVPSSSLSQNNDITPRPQMHTGSQDAVSAAHDASRSAPPGAIKAHQTNAQRMTVKLEQANKLKRHMDRAQTLGMFGIVGFMPSATVTVLSAMYLNLPLFVVGLGATLASIGTTHTQLKNYDESKQALNALGTK